MELPKMLMGVDAQLVVWSQVALLSIKGTTNDECHFASRIVAFCVACFSQALFQREAEGLLLRPLPKCLGQCPLAWHRRGSRKKASACLRHSSSSCRCRRRRRRPIRGGNYPVPPDHPDAFGLINLSAAALGGRRFESPRHRSAKPGRLLPGLHQLRACYGLDH